MTKPRVQGQIGYWVDGQLVHMPKRKQATINREEKAHQKRNRERRKQVMALRKERAEQSSRREGSDKLHRKMAVRMEPLKNASKSGCMTSVLYNLYELAGKFDSKYELWTRSIFIPDFEER